MLEIFEQYAECVLKCEKIYRNIQNCKKISVNNLNMFQMW